MPFDLQAFANRVVSQYVYGLDRPPADIASEDMIRTRAIATSLGELGYGIAYISAEDYMASAGRFTSIGQSELIKAFFREDFSAQLNGQPWVTFTKKDLIAALERKTGNDYFPLNQYQWQWGQYEDDYLLRTFIFNSSEFKINDEVQFRIYADGRREVNNVRVEPLRDDNFDFRSDSIPAQLTADWFIDRVDPFGLGTTVKIAIGAPTGLPVTALYTQEDYRQGLR